MWLSNELVEDVSREAQFFYVNWEATKYWNAKRKVGEPMVFTGWYWRSGEQEGGPFKSMSACYRDAWFRLVLHQTPPPLYGRMRALTLKNKRSSRADAHEVVEATP